MRGSIRAAFALSFGVAACGGEPAGGGTPDWALEPDPQLAVGDRADSDTAQFIRVTDARLTASGQLVVADGGASSVLYFDSTGQERARLGRRGRGPGEFTGGITLAEVGRDSIAVWDPGQSRWALLAGDEPALGADAPAAHAAWIHAGVLVHGETALVPDWAPPLLQVLTDSLPDLRFGFLDETALLWVNTDAEAREWRAYAGSEALGRLTLPAGMRPTQFRGDRVVGVLADSLGLEQVVVLRFARPPRIIPGRGPATPPAPDPEARSQLISAMRNSVVAQEMHYAQHGGYTQTADSLQVEMPAGARFRVLSADARGWRGVGWFTATGYSCGMIIGGVPPRGWGEGEARCGW
jgi:hypothetical protein